MHDPPALRKRKGKTIGKQKQNLSLTGRWIEVLNKACQTNQAGIAARAGIAKSMISKATRGQATRETMLILLHAYDDLVSEQQIELSVRKWQYLFFLAWSDDELLTKEAREAVEQLEREYDP